MDFTSMVKVNALAKELVQKGIAPSSEEASKMAEEFLNTQVLPSTEKKAVSLETIEILLERTQRKFLNETNLVKEQLQSVINEIKFIKEDIKRIKEGNPGKLENSDNQVAESLNQRQIKEQVREQKSKSDSSKNQRTGGLKPGDVNIEDYFYFGDKKKN